MINVRLAPDNSGLGGVNFGADFVDWGVSNVTLQLWSGTTLVGETLRFEAVSRFTIPVVLESATGESSALVLGKGYMNRFMYLAPDAADAVIGEAERLRTAAFRPAHGPPERLPPARRRSTGRTRRRNGTRCWRHPS